MKSQVTLLKEYIDYTIDTLLLTKVRNEKEIRFSEDKYDAIGILFNGKRYNYIVVGMANDEYG